MHKIVKLKVNRIEFTIIHGFLKTIRKRIIWEAGVQRYVVAGDDKNLEYELGFGTLAHSELECFDTLIEKLTKIEEEWYPDET